jgi:hypothetical protein
MVFEHAQAHALQRAAIASIAQTIGYASRRFAAGVRHGERCAGQRPVLTADARERFKQPEREDFDLRLANKIFKKASVYFVQAELDPARANRGGRSLQ